MTALERPWGPTRWEERKISSGGAVQKSAERCGGYEEIHRGIIVWIILKQDRVTCFVQNVYFYSTSRTLLEQDPIS